MLNASTFYAKKFHYLKKGEEIRSDHLSVFIWIFYDFEGVLDKK